MVLSHDEGRTKMVASFCHRVQMDLQIEVSEAMLNVPCEKSWQEMNVNEMVMIDEDDRHG